MNTDQRGGARTSSCWSVEALVVFGRRSCDTDEMMGRHVLLHFYVQHTLRGTFFQLLWSSSVWKGMEIGNIKKKKNRCMNKVKV